MDLRTNPQLELAFDYVRGTSTSIFLTGKAGSGKTTFLHQIKEEGGKRLVVVDRAVFESQSGSQAFRSQNVFWRQVRVWRVATCLQPHSQGRLLALGQREWLGKWLRVAWPSDAS